MQSGRGTQNTPAPNLFGARYLVCGLLLAALSGCATLSRNPVADNVVASRQKWLRGMEAMQAGRWEAAEKLFSEAVATCPADERAHHQYAESLWMRNAWQPAITHMEQSVRLSGGDAQRLVRLGEMYLSQNEVEKAGRQAEQAIQAQPKLARAWVLKGDVLRRQGRSQEAMVSYHRALSHQAHLPDAQSSLAEIYLSTNRPRRALATLESLADFYPPDQIPEHVLFAKGMALKSLERYGDAVDVFQQLAKRSEPPTVDLYYQLAECQYLSGNEANAHLALQTALNLAPGHPASTRLAHEIQRNRDADLSRVERR